MKGYEIDLIPEGKRPQLLQEARAFLNDSLVDARRTGELTEYRARAITQVIEEYQTLMQLAAERGLTFSELLDLVKAPADKSAPVVQAKPSRTGSKAADLRRNAN